MKTPIHMPHPPLAVGFVLAALSVAGAAVGRMTHVADVNQAGSRVQQRDLVFEDRADGAVVVRDAAGLRPVAVFTGENGFLRGTLRGLARTRKAEQVGPEAPFRLSTWSDGRLTLDDPATGRHVELLAFGPDNAAVFARLLPEAVR